MAQAQLTKKCQKCPLWLAEQEEKRREKVREDEFTMSSFLFWFGIMAAIAAIPGICYELLYR